MFGSTFNPSGGPSGNIPYVPIISTTGGALGAYTINLAFYVEIGQIIMGWVDFTIVNNGAGAGLVTVTTPKIVSASAFLWGAGREVAITGAQVFAAAGAGGNLFGVGFYNNAYPGAAGARFRIGFTMQ